MTQRWWTNGDLQDLPATRLMMGDRPPDDFRSNGAWPAPSIVEKVDLRPACHFHDYHYSSLCGGAHDEADRARADRLFLFNLRTCGASPLLAGVYYRRVRLWGHRHYAYRPGCEPRRTWMFWLRLFFSRYVTW